MVKPGNLAGVRTVGAEFRPGPLFLRRIVIGEKEDFRVGVIVRIGAPHDQQRRARFAPAGEIEKIVIGAVAVEVVRALGLVRRKEENRATIGFARQSLPAKPEIRVRLSIQCPCELGKKKNQQQGLTHSESLYLWCEILL